MAEYNNFAEFQAAIEDLIKSPAEVIAGAPKNNPYDLVTILTNLGETVLKFKPQQVESMPSEITFAFPAYMEKSDRHVLTGNKVVSRAAEGNTPYIMHTYFVQGNGVATLTFNAEFLILTDERPAGNILDNDTTYSVSILNYTESPQVIIRATTLPAVDNTAPTFVSVATISSTEIVFTASEALDQNSVPDISAFAFRQNTGGGFQALAGVSIDMTYGDDTQLKVTVAEMTAGAQLESDYTQPQNNPLQDTADPANLMASVANVEVTNSLNASSPVTLGSLNQGTYNAGPPQTVTATGTSSYVFGEELNAVAGNYVEIDIASSDNFAVVVALTDRSTGGSWATINSDMDHAIYVNTNLNTRALADQIDEGISYTSGTWKVRLELADDGEGGLDVLYKYSSNGGSSYTTVRTEPLVIETLNIFFSLALNGKILLNPRLVNNAE